MPPEIHVNDCGTIFEASLVDGGLPMDLRTATSLGLLFMTPAGAVILKPAVLTTDGTDGRMQYTVEDTTFLGMAGRWSWQPRLMFPGPFAAWAGHGEMKDFHVYDNLY